MTIVSLKASTMENQQPSFIAYIEIAIEKVQRLSCEGVGLKRARSTNTPMHIGVKYSPFLRETVGSRVGGRLLA